MQSSQGPGDGEASPKPLKEPPRDIPPELANYRIITTDRRHAKALTEASERAMTGSAGESIPTII